MDVSTTFRGNYQISSSCGSFNTASSTFVDVTNLSVSITTKGGPVLLSLMPDGSTSTMDVNGGSGTEYKLLRGATVVGEWTGTTGNQLSHIILFDTPASGTYTYKLQARNVTSTSFYVEWAKLFAVEL